MLLGSSFLVCNTLGSYAKRRRGQGCIGWRETGAIVVVADRSGWVHEVDAVNTVAATSFGEIQDVIEDGQASEVGVFANLVLRITKLGDVETTNRRRQSGLLCDLGLGLRRHDLGAGSDDDAIGSRVAAVPGIPCCVEQRFPSRIVQDRSTAIVSAISVGFCEAELSMGIHLGDGPVAVRTYGICRVDNGRCIRVRDVKIVDGRNIAHKSQVGAVVDRLSASSDFERNLLPADLFEVGPHVGSCSELSGN